jgi:hypothetical protein
MDTKSGRLASGPPASGRPFSPLNQNSMVMATGDRMYAKWVEVTDEEILSHVRKQAKINGTDTVMDIPRPLFQYVDLSGKNEGLKDMFLLSKEQDLVLCNACGLVYRMSTTISNLRSGHLATEVHVRATDPSKIRAADEIAERVRLAVGRCCVGDEPFNSCEPGRRLAELINREFSLTGIFVRQLCVATGIIVQRELQQVFNDSQRRVICAYMLIDGWSRKMNSQKMLAARLRVIFEDGGVEEHSVSLHPYTGSVENARSLAEEIHRVAAMYGVEPYLKAVLTDSPSVTIAAVRIYNWWRVSQGMPPVDHSLCLIHRFDLVWKRFEAVLSETCEPWQQARELVKIVRR